VTGPRPEPDPAAGADIRVVAVDDRADPRLCDYQGLTDVALRSKSEPPRGLFIAEGSLVITRALAAGFSLRSALVSPKWLDALLPVLQGMPAPVYVGSEELLREVTGFHVHRGALAAMERKPLPTLRGILATARRLVVLEDMVSHTNLGAIFRSAAGLGMDAVVLTPSCADPLYRRSVRVSMGGVFALPWTRLDGWPGDVETLRAAGFSLMALTPGAGSEDLEVVARSLGSRSSGDSTGRRVAVMLGTEGAGLSRAAIAAADHRVRIPMAHGVDSLNVAAAAAIAFYALRA